MAERDERSREQGQGTDGGGREGGPREGRPRFGAGAQRPADGERPGGGGGGPRGPRRGGGGGGRFGSRRKVCPFCMDNVQEVDYKDISRLRRHLSERGKIEARRKFGTCARHQRALTVAIKRARHVALLPFTTSAR